MASLNLDAEEATILLLGFSIGYKTFRNDSAALESIKKFQTSIFISDRDKLLSLVSKLNQLSQDALNESTNLPNL